MADDHEERFCQHEAVLEGLSRMRAAQRALNERQDAMNERLTLAIERIDRTLAHVEITQARMETLLARMFPPGKNGRDA